MQVAQEVPSSRHAAVGLAQGIALTSRPSDRAVSIWVSIHRGLLHAVHAQTPAGRSGKLKMNGILLLFADVPSALISVRSVVQLYPGPWYTTASPSIG